MLEGLLEILTFQPLLELDQDIQLEGGFFNLRQGGLGELAGIDGEIAAIAEIARLGNDLVEAAAEVGAGSVRDIVLAVVVLGEILLELVDRVGLFALANAHELFAGEKKVDAA